MVDGASYQMLKNPFKAFHIRSTVSVAFNMCYPDARDVCLQQILVTYGIIVTPHQGERLGTHW